MSADQEEVRGGENQAKDLSNLGVVETDELIDSLAFLLGISFGDVRAGLNADRFEEMAIQALRNFRQRHYKTFLGDPNFTDEELDDMRLLKDSLDSVELELCKTDNRDYRIQLEKEKIEIRAAIRRLEEENVHSAKLRDRLQ